MRSARDAIGRTVTMDSLPDEDSSGMAFAVVVTHPAETAVSKQAPEVHRFSSEDDADRFFETMCNALGAEE